MDVLVSLGTNAAYLYSLLAILAERMQAGPARRTRSCHRHPVPPDSEQQCPACAPAAASAGIRCSLSPVPWLRRPLLACLPAWPLAWLQPHRSPSPGGGGMAMGSDFFETAAMLITLVLFGKYLESAVRSEWVGGRGCWWWGLVWDGLGRGERAPMSQAGRQAGAGGASWRCELLWSVCAALPAPLPVPCLGGAP